MDECEFEILSRELEADLTFALQDIDRELEKKTGTLPIDDYEIIQKVGQGTFGEVFKVRHKRTKCHYALKRLKMEKENEGFPITALREIRILKSLSHDNIVCLRGICHKKNNNQNSNYRYDFYLLFDFCDHDLAGLLQQKIEFSLPIRKSIMHQLLTGLYFLHKNNVLHRDLKASNILIDKMGRLKIADFGLARFTVASLRPDRPPRYTGTVVTLWYRPPEILLNCRNYGRPVDMWGAGCIMAELWTQYPIMQGENEMQQMKYIIQLCGSITPEVWPGVERLETYQRANLPRDLKRHVKEKLTPQIKCPSAVDLIDRLLALNPVNRLSADESLNHEFFHEDPPMGDLSSLSRNGTSCLEYLGQPSRNRNNHGNRYNAHPQANYQGRRNALPGQAVGPTAYRNPRNAGLDQDSNLGFDRVY